MEAEAMEDDELENGPSGDPSSWEDLGEETIETDLNSEFTTETDENGKTQELNLDTGEYTGDRDIESAWWSDSDDAQDLKDELDHDYSRAYTETHLSDGSKDSDVLHNIGAAATRAGDKVVGWLSSAKDAADRALGSATNAGRINADIEENKQARDAYNSYMALYEKYKDSDPEKAQGLLDKANSIDRSMSRSDTGSRIGNIGKNIAEDIGDIGWRANQILGGGDKYGLSKNGWNEDRNFDGKVSFGERLANMARNTGAAIGNAAKNAGKADMLALVSGGNPLVALGAAGLAYAGKKGYEALRDYAASHPASANNNTAVADNDSTDSDSSDSIAEYSNEPIQTASIAEDKTPIARNNWSSLKLNSLAKNRQSFGKWSGVNDTMGERTLALSDAHFKDFCLAMLTDDPNIRNVLSNKMMLEYFRNI